MNHCIMLLLLSILVFIHAISCGNSQSNTDFVDLDAQSITYLVQPDTLDKWRDWAMRSDEGLWKDVDEHPVELRLISTYGGENMLHPPFYKVNWMHLSGDTLFISDQAAEKLVCMGLDGTVYWEYGEEGEGPGHFCRIGGIDTGRDWIAVCNIYGGRVEILDRNGELTSIITVSNPQDVIALSDSTLAILSKAQSGGNLHVYALPDSLLYSFGEPEWTHWGTRSNKDLTGLLAGDTVVVTSKFCNQMYFFDLGNRTVSPDFAREYPADYEVTNQGVAWHVMGTPFLGPDSCICVYLPPFNNDGTFRVTNSPFEEWAPVTIVDRYSRNGEYLDSFCIPVRGGFDCIYSQEYGLFVKQYSTGTIYRFEICD